MKPIVFVIGTRPEIIKLGPIIRECISRKINYSIIHTNQHYSKNLDEIFFDELSLPRPNYSLNIGVESSSHTDQIGGIITRLGKILGEISPSVVISQGDTNSVVAATLAGNKSGFKTAHVEAGLRSYDRSMPEEINRIISDHISDFLFAVTDVQYKILKKEGIQDEKIYVVGNSIVDSVYQNIEIAKNKSKIIKDLSLVENEFILLTAHRDSNVDYEDKLKVLIDACSELQRDFNLKVVWPLHPRARKNIEKFKLNTKDIIISEPLGYLDFLMLQQNARVIITDSGGVQEEACILGIPCMTIRDNTERPETIAVGSNVLVGMSKGKIISEFEKVMGNSSDWENPFGDGHTSKKIIDILVDNLN